MNRQRANQRIPSPHGALQHVQYVVHYSLDLVPMTYSIQWELLVEEEEDLMDALGIETGASSAKFTRDLLWEEITIAFAHFVSLRKRTPMPEESHVNFAIGDCLVEMERLFGKERTEQFASEFLRLSACRDFVLGLAGGALIYLQQVEEVIKGCCACLNLKGIRLTVADFLASDPDHRRLTLGQMKNALLNTGAFSAGFEEQLNNFVQDRNRFVHSLWVEDARTSPHSELPCEEDFVRVADFINDLGRRAYRIERIFKGLWAALGEPLSQGLPPEADNSATINRWLKYIPEFRDVLRNKEACKLQNVPKK